MARYETTFTCTECSFRTYVPLEALDHANDIGHTLTAEGTVKPGTPRPLYRLPESSGGNRNRGKQSPLPEPSNMPDVSSKLSDIRKLIGK